MFVVVQDEKEENNRRQPAVDEITNAFGSMKVSRRKGKENVEVTEETETEKKALGPEETLARHKTSGLAGSKVEPRRMSHGTEPRMTRVEATT